MRFKETIIRKECNFEQKIENTQRRDHKYYLLILVTQSTDTHVEWNVPLLQQLTSCRRSAQSSLAFLALVLNKPFM